MEHIKEKLRAEIINTDILSKVDTIEQLLNEVEDQPELLQECVNMVKNAVQHEAARKLAGTQNYRGLLAMATGTGKSKIPINILKRVNSNIPDQTIEGRFENVRVLLIVPTQKLRDENWRDEFEKWGALDVYNFCVNTVCYASLKGIKGRTYDLVIGDEIHNLTPKNAEFFKNNEVKRFIGLTATEPENKIKQQLFKNLAIPTVYKLPLDIAVRLRLVSPFDITVVECRLDNVNKHILAGNKDKPFYQTEQEAYNYHNQKVDHLMYNSDLPRLQKAIRLKFAIMNRMRFIKTLPSKTNAAHFLLNHVIPEDERTLIFAGGIEQAIELCPHRFFSKVSVKKGDKPEKVARATRIMEHYEGDKWFNLFKEGAINRCSCVDAVNEGHNLTDVKRIDNLLVSQLDSNDTNITQRLGRGIRYEAGHTCKVYIIVIVDTIDETWFRNATAKLNQSKIKRVRYENLVSGNVVL